MGKLLIRPHLLRRTTLQNITGPVLRHMKHRLKHTHHRKPPPGIRIHYQKIRNNIAVRIRPLNRKRLGKNPENVLLERLTEHLILLLSLDNIPELMAEYTPTCTGSYLNIVS